MSKREATRARIFIAAMELAEADGLLNITIDRVADKAGLSKGGVLHHFASKDELLSGVIEYFSAKLEEYLTRIVAEDPNRRHRWVRAMLSLATPGGRPHLWKQIFGESETFDASQRPFHFDRFMLSILAVAVHNPQLVQPIRSIGQRLRGRLTADPEDGLEQIICWLIVDGLFLWQFVGLIAPNDPLVEQILGEIRRRIES